MANFCPANFCTSGAKLNSKSANRISARAQFADVSSNPCACACSLLSNSKILHFSTSLYSSALGTCVHYRLNINSAGLYYQIIAPIPSIC